VLCKIKKEGRVKTIKNNKKIAGDTVIQKLTEGEKQ